MRANFKLRLKAQVAGETGMQRLQGYAGALKASVIAAASCLALVPAARADVVTYDFDTLSDSEVLTGQYTGLTFSNALVLSAGFTLNEFEFPPLSGANVITDNGGAITIDLSSPVFSISAFFTYVSSLSFAVYDGANALLGTVNGGFGSNLASSGDFGSNPNELLSFSSITGSISRIVITGDVAGGSFVLDNLTIDTGTATPVPEPGTLALVAGLLSLGCVPGGWMRRSAHIKR
jgi:hypothetical protein